MSDKAKLCTPIGEKGVTILQSGVVQSAEITIPNIKLNLDQLLTVIRHLDKPSRIKVAKVLAETEMNAERNGLINRLEGIPEKMCSDKRR